MSIEAMKQALEALEVMKAGHCAEEKIYINNAITALRQAIEQAEKQQALDKKAENARELGLDYEQAEKQEPVAWVANINLGAGLVTKSIDFCRSSNPIATHTPLYTAPPRKEWVGLTEEEILSAAEEVPITCIRQRDYDLHFAPIIEAKLKEKNA